MHMLAAPAGGRGGFDYKKGTLVFFLLILQANEHSHPQDIFCLQKAEGTSSKTAMRFRKLLCAIVTVAIPSSFQAKYIQKFGTTTIAYLGPLFKPPFCGIS